MPFLPAILKEGEIRLIIVGKKKVFVAQRQTSGLPGAFNTSFDYIYTPLELEEWSELVTTFLSKVDVIFSRLGVHEAPLIWTADFIPHRLADGKMTYYLSEINCSCAGFRPDLDRGIQDAVAEELVRRLRKRG